MRRAFVSIGVLGLVAAALACSKSGGGGNGAPVSASIATLCAKFVACGAYDATGTAYTQSSCESELAPWVPPAACASVASGATCAEVTAASGSYAAACYPACVSGTANACDGNDLVTCYDLTGSTGSMFTWSCAAACTTEDATYAGSCSTSYEGAVASDGQAYCWCIGGDGGLLAVGGGSAVIPPDDGGGVRTDEDAGDAGSCVSVAAGSDESGGALQCFACPGSVLPPNAGSCTYVTAADGGEEVCCPG